MAQKQIAIIESMLGEDAWQMVYIAETASEAWTRLVIHHEWNEAKLKALFAGDDWIIENGDYAGEYFVQNKRVLKGRYELSTLLKIEDYLNELITSVETTPSLEEVDEEIWERGEWQDGDDANREDAAKAEAIREIAKTLLAVIRNEKKGK